MTEGKMVGWHHRLNGLEFEQTLGDDEGKGILACRSLWGFRIRHDLVTEPHKEKSIKLVKLYPQNSREI